MAKFDENDNGIFNERRQTKTNSAEKATKAVKS